MMKHKFFSMIVGSLLVSLLVVSIIFPFMGGAQPGRGGRPPQGMQQGGRGGGPQGGPPPEAIEACSGKQDGKSCEFQTPHGKPSGTCRTMQNQTVCIPKGRPGMQNTQTSPPYMNAIPLENRLVDTGQMSCYDYHGAIECPSQGDTLYGQDAHYQSKAPVYQDNGDGTVTDLNTGLMWQQDPSEKMTCAEAVNKVSSFNLAGYSDWRLPTITELYSLIQFSGIDPGPQGDVVRINNYVRCVRNSRM